MEQVVKGGDGFPSLEIFRGCTVDMLKENFLIQESSWIREPYVFLTLLLYESLIFFIYKLQQNIILTNQVGLSAGLDQACNIQSVVLVSSPNQLNILLADIDQSISKKGSSFSLVANKNTFQHRLLWLFYRCIFAPCNSGKACNFVSTYDLNK